MCHAFPLLLGFAAMLLGESVSVAMLVTTFGVVASVAGAKKFAA
jgi:hypothetical protein